jgi:hypothetical protein
LKTSLDIRGSEYGSFSFQKNFYFICIFCADTNYGCKRYSRYTIGIDVVSEMLDLHAGQQLNLPLEEHVELVELVNQTTNR